MLLGFHLQNADGRVAALFFRCCCVVADVFQDFSGGRVAEKDGLERRAGRGASCKEKSCQAEERLVALLQNHCVCFQLPTQICL